MVYTFNSLIKIVKRENNKKRSFLFLNLLQAKYVPANPKDTVSLFQALSKKIPDIYLNKKTVVIGFSETATAIGAVVAERLKEKGFYLTTTREKMEEKNLIVSFEEEHSHAPSHFLYCSQKEQLKDCEVILFVDDELTTGKTILNLIEVLKQSKMVNSKVKFIVLSIVNCMTKEHRDFFKEKGIFFDALIYKEKDWSKTLWKENLILEKEKKPKETCLYQYKEIKGKLEIREGAFILDYQRQCQYFCKEALKVCEVLLEQKEILILGTEECMYPAILTALSFQEFYKEKQFFVYATSRSPILALEQKNYPIQNRSKVKSFYQKEREIFIYNLRKYDKVIIVTDANKIEKEAIEETICVLQQFGNKDITILKWIKNEV